MAGRRMIRDWTDSITMDSLSIEAERFFTRLIMKADDFGRYHANLKLLKAALFPLKDEITANDIQGWLYECTKKYIESEHPLITLYESKGQKYLVINKFGQRLRSMQSKFPDPPTNDSKPPRELNKKIEDEQEHPIEPTKFTPPSLEDVIAYFKQEGYKESAARKAFKYYASNDWKDGKNKPVSNWQQKMIANWMKDEDKLGITSNSTKPALNTPKEIRDYFENIKTPEKFASTKARKINFVHKWGLKLWETVPAQPLAATIDKKVTQLTQADIIKLLLKHFDLQ